MSKRVLIVSTSPRRGGNSDTLAGTVFAGGVNAAGDIQGHRALADAHEMGKAV